MRRYDKNIIWKREMAKKRQEIKGKKTSLENLNSIWSSEKKGKIRKNKIHNIQDRL